ncbi:MAG: hypothetical protein IKF38_05860 [Clostridia bacterium]|nr:hypothetical protein [Clostridia bacterium]
MKQKFKIVMFKIVMFVILIIAIIVLFIVSAIIAMIKINSDSNGLSGGEDILFDFIASWENEAMLHYMRGDEYAQSYNSSPFISEYVTEDKKFYICNTDWGLNNGTRNFGFGVMHYQNGTWNNVEFYKEVGIDIMQSKYTQIGTLLEVEIVDRVKANIIQYMLDRVRNETEGLNLRENQIHALVDIMYQGGNINGFVECYKRYGDTESLRNSYSRFEGTRGEARWKLFHEGIYTTREGLTLNPSNYISLSGGSAKGQIDINDNNYVIFENAKKAYQIIQDKGFYQASNSAWDSDCLGFAYVYTHAIYTGDMSNLKNSYHRGNDDVTGYFGVGSEVQYSNKEKLVKDVFALLKAGKPCILQVVGTSSNGSPRSRHYVSVVGYKKGVTQKNVKDTDLLILDTWDGELEPVVPEYTSGRYILDADVASRNYGYHYQYYKMLK